MTNNNRDGFGRQLRGLFSAGLKEFAQIGDTVVCLRTDERLGITENSSYQLERILAQKFNPQEQQMQQTELESLDDSLIPKGYERYVTLSSSNGNEIIPMVKPEEVGLVTVRSQVIESAWLAIPGFFWIFVCVSFANVYHERTGGDFWDAFWGR